MENDPGKIINALSIDVEDYFQVSAFEAIISRDAWDSLPCRVERNTDRLIGILENADVKATFFVLGWVAERYPSLVRGLVHNGHEIASHGYAHVRATEQEPAEFRQDVERTKKLLEDISGTPVRGYRAASYSVNQNNLWVMDALSEAGYEYSSSIYPIRHDLYGMPDAPRFPFRHEGSNLQEIPISTAYMFRRRVPCGGGGYFRLYPYELSRWFIRRINRHEHQPCVFYIHPWEIDPEQPVQKGIDLKTRFRHYFNLHRTESRLSRLLSDFSWSRMDDVYLARPPVDL